MGKAHVFCCHCEVRLLDADFDAGTAYRIDDDRACCSACVEEVVAEMPAEQQEEILFQHKRKKSSGTTARPRTETGKTKTTGRVTTVKPGSGPKRQTQSIPKAPPAEEASEEEAPAGNNKKKILILAGAGGGGLVLLVVVLLLVLGGGKKPEKSAASGPAAPAAVSPEEAAKAAVQKAEDYQRQNRSDYGGQWAKIQEAAATATAGPLAARVDALKAELRKRVETETGDLEAKLQQGGAIGREEFKSILDDLRKARDRHDVPAWREPIEAQIQAVNAKIFERLDNVKKLAAEAKAAGQPDAVKGYLDRVEKWGLPEHLAELRSAIDAATASAATPKPPTPASEKTPDAPVEKPPSPAVLAYRERWQKALFAAYAHDFPAAIAELERVGKDSEDAEAKAEAQQDLALLRRAAELFAEGEKLAASLARHAKVDLEYADSPSEYKKAAGGVVKADATRIEVKTGAGEKDRAFVEVKALSCGAMAALARGKRGEKPEDAEARALAALALLEGDTDGARTILKGAEHKLPSRYWAHGAEVRAKAPRADRREFEARKLFHAAELEWRKIATWGQALERYKLLQNEYAVSDIVRTNLDLILKRGSVGKEYVKGADELQVEGIFKRVKVAAGPKNAPESAAQCSRDEDVNQTLEHYAELEFYALPATSYRCWALVGACCAETYGFYYQATEAKDGKETIEPGSSKALRVDPKLTGLKKTHAQHTKDAKAPARWEWISLPLPKEFASPGPKSVRFMNTQQGFSVGVVIVSSLRKTVPSEAETKEILKEAAVAPSREMAPAAGGSPDPADWLLLGPFDYKGINAVLPPEGDPGLDKEFDGKAGKIKWKDAKAELQAAAGAAKAGVFDFLKILNPINDVAVFALIHVKAPKAMDARILCGSDDQLKVWVNGKAVHTFDKNRGVKVDEDAVTVKLEAGWNRLLFKVGQNGGGWGLAARVTDAAKKPIPGLEYHPYGD